MSILILFLLIVPAFFLIGLIIKDIENNKEIKGKNYD